jgi:hypothetical protein
MSFLWDLIIRFSYKFQCSIRGDSLAKFFQRLIFGCVQRGIAEKAFKVFFKEFGKIPSFQLREFRRVRERNNGNKCGR